MQADALRQEQEHRTQSRATAKAAWRAIFLAGSGGSWAAIAVGLMEVSHLRLFSGPDALLFPSWFPGGTVRVRACVRACGCACACACVLHAQAGVTTGTIMHVPV